MLEGGGKTPVLTPAQLENIGFKVLIESSNPTLDDGVHQGVCDTVQLIMWKTVMNQPPCIHRGSLLPTHFLFLE